MRQSPGEFRTWLSNLHLLLNEELSDFPQSEHRHGILADKENWKRQSKMQHSLESFFWKFTYNIISAKDNKKHWAAYTIRLKANLCRYCKIRANDPVSWNSAFLFIVERSVRLFLYPSPSLLRMCIGLLKLQIAQQLIRWYSLKKYRKVSIFMTLLQCEKKPLYSTSQCHRHHKNDRSTRTRNRARRMYITSQFKWNWNWYSVLSVERCLFEKSTASHVAFAEQLVEDALTLMEQSSFQSAFTCSKRSLAISRWSFIAAIWRVVKPSLLATFRISPAFASNFSTAL